MSKVTEKNHGSAIHWLVNWNIFAVVSVGFAIFSIFGVAGSTATSFLREYEIPLRLLSIAILLVTYFYMARKLGVACSLKN